MLDRRTLLASAVAAPLALRGREVRAASTQTIRIGVLTDMSGVYRDIEGPTGVACAQQAVDEFTAANPGAKVEIVVGDHQNKPDIGLTVIREWLDRGDVDLIADIGNSAVALAASTIVEAKDKIAIVTSASNSDLTGKSCSRNLLHWSYDSWSTGHLMAVATVKAGGDKWFFLTPDYSAGHALQRDATDFVVAAGGKVVGAAVYPFPTTSDFSSYLLGATASGANVISFTGSGDDLSNGLKQMQEFGLQNGTIKVAALVGYITNVLAMGLQNSQGLLLVENFYWDFNERTRGFMGRVKPKLSAGVFPNMSQAGNYSAVVHYLKAVSKIGVDRAKASGRDVIEVMKAMPTDDDCFGQGAVRADGRKIHETHLWAVKTPRESKGQGDVFKLVATLSPEESFRPIRDGECPLIRS